MRSRLPDRINKPIRTRMDTSGLPFPKPGPREKSQPKDGRLIERPTKYQLTKAQMWARQSGFCGKEGCRNYMPSPSYGHRHHPGGRGIGGSRRDDRNTVLWCIPCHEAEHDLGKKLAFRRTVRSTL